MSANLKPWQIRAFDIVWTIGMLIILPAFPRAARLVIKPVKD